MTAPLALAAVGVFLSILAIFLVRTEEGADQGKLISALSRGLYVSSIGIGVVAIPILYILEIPNMWPVFISILVGLVVGFIVTYSPIVNPWVPAFAFFTSVIIAIGGTLIFGGHKDS